ncbi:MAG: hypothetical protein AAGG07_04500 [Planctomycetota bacterium]
MLLSGGETHWFGDERADAWRVGVPRLIAERGPGGALLRIEVPELTPVIGLRFRGVVPPGDYDDESDTLFAVLDESDAASAYDGPAALLMDGGGIVVGVELPRGD